MLNPRAERALSARPSRSKPHMPPPIAKKAELEAALDRITQSYEGPLEVNNLESAALPNKRAVIEAYNHLVPAIYMGFYSRRGLCMENLRDSIGEHLYPAFSGLVEQIGRATSYEDSAGKRRVPHSADFAEGVVLRLFDRIPEVRRILNTDVLAAYEGDPAANSIEEIVFSYPAVRSITAHRIANILYTEGVPMIPRILSEYAHSETGIDIHAGARIGESFFIDHGTGVVIGETTSIGRNVKLYQGVTLGALSVPRSRESSGAFKRHPTIEDDVTIYAGASIMGGDTVIGRGSVIGSNVFITRSVEPGSKIFGRPKE